MHTARWIGCLWPGLGPVWFRGSGIGLAWACAFAVLFNFSLVTTFVWTEFVSSEVNGATWLTAACIWSVSAVLSLRRPADALEQEREALFRTAQREYLKGNWYQAETAVRSLLQHDWRDAESRLLLATLLRHTRRWDEASEQLALLERLEAAHSWQLEITREREQLQELVDGNPQTTGDSETNIAESA